MSVTAERTGKGPMTVTQVEPEPSRSARRAATQGGVIVLIVEEHDVSRCGLRLIMANQPWVRACSSAANLTTAIDQIQRGAPDIVLYGARPGLADAHQVGRALRDAAPESLLLMLSEADRVTAQTLSMVGAYAHVCKNGSIADIAGAVRMASLGLRSTPVATPSMLLSTRQQEVLHLLAGGETNSEIARRLFLSAHTVKQHTCAIYRKLQVRNRAEAISRAQLLGLLS